MVSLFGSLAPDVAAVSDGVPYELGMKFQVSQGGVVDAIRFFKSPGDNGVHTGRIWSATGALITSVQFTNETASGWQQQPLPSKLRLIPGITYVVSVNTPGLFPITYNAFVQPVSSGGITALSGTNGLFGTTGKFPTGYFKSSNYFRDIAFSVDVTVQPMSGGGAGIALAGGSLTTAPANPVTGSGSGSASAGGGLTTIPSMQITGSGAATAGAGAQLSTPHLAPVQVAGQAIAGVVLGVPFPGGTQAVWTISNPAVARLVLRADGSGADVLAVAAGDTLVSISAVGYDPVTVSLTIADVDSGQPSFMISPA